MSSSSGVHVGLPYRIARRATQALAIVAILISPFLGGWQRLERNDLSSWARPDTGLNPALRERLPRGDTAGAAHDNNRLIGGGAAVEYFGVPVADPVLGVFALIVRPPTLRAVVALLLPILLAVGLGRVFCGWFCPFGTLSRALAWLRDLLPIKRPYRIPPRRPVRYFILAVGLLAGFLGAHVVLYATLPHLLLHQSVYSIWLLNGGGAALGLLLGLIIAGLIVGPTAYCATLCPTGAALRLLGQKKVVHLKIAAPVECGKSCRRCSLSCWLQLDPASGDPGPDCDVCGRCVPQCPKTNLRVGFGKGEPATRVKAAAALFALCAAFGAAPADAQNGRAYVQPEMVLSGEHVVDGVTVAVDVIDQTGVRLAADSDITLQGCDVSVFLARGERDEPDERGQPARREIYDGPLAVRVERGERVERLLFDAPSAPRSTPMRAIYRERVPIRLRPGDAVVIEPVAGWLEEEHRFEVPRAGVDASVSNTLISTLLGLAIFLGLLLLALGVPPPRPAAPRVDPG